MYHIFLDTNVLLSLYKEEYSALNEKGFRDLKKILEENKSLKLIVNEVVYNEFFQNRNKCTISSFNKFIYRKGVITEKIKEIETKSPFFISSSLNEEKNSLSDIVLFLNEIEENIKNKAKNFNLEADNLIKDFFNDIKKVNQEVIVKAQARISIGMPPGKNNDSNKNIGDSINWEWLINEIPDGEDLVLLTFDGGFRDENINDNNNNNGNNNFMYLLESEWSIKKRSKIHFFHNFNEMIEFLKNSINSNLKEDFETNDVKKYIDSLNNSNNFKDVHYYTWHLLKHKNLLTTENVFEIFKIMVTNRQIYWIFSDKDVSELYDFVDNFNFENQQEELTSSLIFELKEVKNKIFNQKDNWLNFNHYRNKIEELFSKWKNNKNKFIKKGLYTNE